MAETKYGKYIVDTLRGNIPRAPWSPPVAQVGKGRSGRLFYLDNEVVEGAFYLECAWIVPPEKGKPLPPDLMAVKAHTHEYDEVLCFFGTNPDDFYDLGGELELYLGDEAHIIDRSCIVFVPAGLSHGPLTMHRVDRPIFHFTSGPGGTYFKPDKG